MSSATGAPLTVGQKIEAAEKLNEAGRELVMEGNKLTKEGKTDDARKRWTTARGKYTRMFGLVNGLQVDGEAGAMSGLIGGGNVPEVGADQGDQIKALQLKANLNTAFMNLKLENYEACVKFCGKALEKHENHPKALFRRLQARAALKDLDGAEEDLRALEALNDPKLKGNVDTAKRLVATLREGHAKKEKKAFGGFLSKQSKKSSKGDDDNDDDNGPKIEVLDD